MTERGDLTMMARLIEVQRVKRQAAQSALALAQQTEQAARASEEEARGQCSTAHEQWETYIARPGFSPEYSLSLSNRLIASEAEAENARRRARLASELRGQKEHQWQTLEARVRLSEQGHRRMKRKADRRREEERLSELADRTTLAWSVR